MLSAHGGKIQGLNLQSYLFFGSANRLYQHVKALLARHPECRFLLFDFKLVTGINSSAAYSFAQIKRTAQDRGIKLVLVHLPPAAEKALRSSEFVSHGGLHRARTRSRAGVVRERDHRAASGPRARGGLLARLVHPRFSAPRTTPRN